MKIAACFALALLMSLSAIAASPEMKSGPQPGDDLDAFQVTKLAGAGNDNVAIGDKLCYRCMLGDRPVVMVFAREINMELATLITALDKEVVAKGDQKLASFVNLLGNNPSVLKQSADAIIDRLQVKNIPIVMPEDNVDGPKSYNINPKRSDHRADLS